MINTVLQQTHDLSTDSLLSHGESTGNLWDIRDQ